MAFDALSAILPTKVFFPGSDEFEESAKSYFTAFENEINPGCIVRPSSAEDVAALVKEFVSSDRKFAVRGGGHTPWAGAANLEGGVTVDMRGLSGVTSRDDEKSVFIGAGERWRNVYQTLDQKKLATVGGRVSKVGVAGLILGGGLSYFSDQYGFVCDGVISFEVVLATGEIVTASKKSYPDLFAALKGGSTNFGIVTRFELPTFPSDSMWGGINVFPGTCSDDLVRAFHDFTISPTPDPHAHVIASVVWSAATGMEASVVGAYHTDSQTLTAPPSVSPLTSLEPSYQSTLRKATLLELTEEQSAFTADAARQLFFTTTIKADLELLLKVIEFSRVALKTVQDAEGLSWTVIIQPMTTQLLKKSEEAGENSLGLSSGDGPLVNVLVNPTWGAASDDDRIVAASMEVITKTDEEAAKMGKAAKYRFMNYGHKTQDIFQGVGEERLAKMREVSRKYDPKRFFQTNFVGGFKIGS